MTCDTINNVCKLSRADPANRMEWRKKLRTNMCDPLCGTANDDDVWSTALVVCVVSNHGVYHMTNIQYCIEGNCGCCVKHFVD